MGGTSIATPLVAEAVGLIREFLRIRKGFAKPSPSFLRAALIAGALRFLGLAPSGSVIDNHQGFGRGSVNNVLTPHLPAKVDFIDVTFELHNGGSWSQTIRVASAGSQLRVVLAYSDYPGSNLINNLNLIVTSPSGTT